MKLLRNTLWIVLLVACTAGRALAQTGADQMPPMPKPGPQHQVLKMDAGTWDAVVEFIPRPGAPPMTSKGVEVNTIGCGGLCLISDFTGEAMGMPFHGHGITTWDAGKKKYTGSWTDSMSTGLAVAEMTHDPAAKTMTGWMEGPDMTGTVTRMRTVVDHKKDGVRVMTSYAPGPDGKEMPVLKITYTRRN